MQWQFHTIAANPLQSFRQPLMAKVLKKCNQNQNTYKLFSGSTNEHCSVEEYEVYRILLKLKRKRPRQQRRIKIQS